MINLKLSDSTKKTLVSVGINFFIGAMLGIILFYSQMKQDGIKNYGVEMVHKAKPADFLRLLWMNMLWLISIFIARSIAPVRHAHPIVMIRGCVCAFTASFILNQCGIKEAAAAIIPQCLSIFPAMAAFSSVMVNKRIRAVTLHTDPDALKRHDLLIIALLSAAAAVLEILFFSLFILCLF